MVVNNNPLVVYNGSKDFMVAYNNLADLKVMGMCNGSPRCHSV